MWTMLGGGPPASRSDNIFGSVPRDTFRTHDRIIEGDMGGSGGWRDAQPEGKRVGREERGGIQKG